MTRTIAYIEVVNSYSARSLLQFQCEWRFPCCYVFDSISISHTPVLRQVLLFNCIELSSITGWYGLSELILRMGPACHGSSPRLQTSLWEHRTIPSPINIIHYYKLNIVVNLRNFWSWYLHLDLPFQWSSQWSSEADIQFNSGASREVGLSHEFR